MWRRERFILSLILLVTLPTCGDGSGTTPPQTIARASLAIRPNYLDPPCCAAPSRPESLEFSLLLFDDGGGIIGATRRPAFYETVSLAAITWQRLDAGMIEVDSGEVAALRTGRLGWTRLALDLRDADGDGILDEGMGSAEGTWNYFVGDTRDYSKFDAPVTVSTDRAAPEASLLSAEFLPPEAALPTDPLRVVFAEPVEWASARDGTQFLVDGEPLMGNAIPENLMRGLVTGISFQPKTFLPFGAEIAIDVASVADPSGNRAIWDGVERNVPTDPGDLRENPGFENGLDHWTAFGWTQDVGVIEEIEPSEGDAQAALPGEDGYYGYLLGYADVPADAVELSFTAAVLDPCSVFLAGAVQVSVHSARETIVVFDASDLRDEICPDGVDFDDVVILPQNIRVDLKPLRRQRVFLRAFVINHIFSRPVLLVDDFRISRTGQPAS